MLRVHLFAFVYGALEAQTSQAILRELFLARENPETELYYSPVHDDALISRSRSRSVSRFLKATDSEVMFFLDHDIEWNPGDLIATARKALEVNGVVGGIYSCRAFGAGFASRPKEIGPMQPGTDELITAEYVAGGFTAFSRRALLRAITRLDIASPEFDPESPPEFRLRRCEADVGEDDYWPLFAPVVTKSTVSPGKWTYLSEDWSGCARLAWTGVPLFLWSKPVLRHWGRHGYTLQDGARSKKQG